MHVDVNGTLGVDRRSSGRLPRPAQRSPGSIVAQLARVASPALVCCGDLDSVTPVPVSREIVDALPTGIGRLEVLEGAGHFPWLDVSGTYFALIDDFVRF